MLSVFVLQVTGQFDVCIYIEIVYDNKGLAMLIIWEKN